MSVPTWSLVLSVHCPWRWFMPVSITEATLSNDVPSVWQWNISQSVGCNWCNKYSLRFYFEKFENETASTENVPINYDRARIVRIIKRNIKCDWYLRTITRSLSLFIPEIVSSTMIDTHNLNNMKWVLFTILWHSSISIWLCFKPYLNLNMHSFVHMIRIERLTNQNNCSH
jgi:hypothetical protein